jgi:hypothetical protein
VQHGFQIFVRGVAAADRGHAKGYVPLPFRRPILTISPSQARLFHSSVSRFTFSRYVFASSLPSTSSCG